VITSALTVGIDILTDSRQITRLEIVDTGRRRRWSESEKIRTVEESLSSPQAWLFADSERGAERRR
jgi:hypothetical protein